MRTILILLFSVTALAQTETPKTFTLSPDELAYVAQVKEADSLRALRESPVYEKIMTLCHSSRNLEEFAKKYFLVTSIAFQSEKEILAIPLELSTLVTHYDHHYMPESTYDLIYSKELPVALKDCREKFGDALTPVDLSNLAMTYDFLGKAGVLWTLGRLFQLNAAYGIKPKIVKKYTELKESYPKSCRLILTAAQVGLAAQILPELYTLATFAFSSQKRQDFKSQVTTTIESDRDQKLDTNRVEIEKREQFIKFLDNEIAAAQPNSPEKQHLEFRRAQILKSQILLKSSLTNPTKQTNQKGVLK